MRAELASRAGLTLRRARFDPIEAQRRAIPTRGVLNLLDRRRDPQPDQCLADCTVDVAGTRIGLRLKDRGDALGEGRTKRRLELRPSRERSSARPLAGSRHRLGAADGILLACKVRDQIADDLKLFDIIVSNFNVEAILNGNHQLDAVEKVSAEIVNKMGFACYKTGIDVQMFRDKKANIVQGMLF